MSGGIGQILTLTRGFKSYDDVINLIFQALQSIVETIANQAEATMQLNNVPEALPTVETRIQYTIAEDGDSTDPAIVDYNTTDHYFQLKKAGDRYQLIGNMITNNISGNKKYLTFRLRNHDTNDIIKEFEPLEIERGTNNQTPLILGPDFIDTPVADVNVYLTYQCSANNAEVIQGTATILTQYR